jgi:uncharacterized membrane protein
MRSFRLLLFIGVLLGTVAAILATAGALPDPVATHFGAKGAPDAWMPRGAYIAMVLAMAVGLSMFMVVIIGVLPRAIPEAMNVPNREYWLVAHRRPILLRTMSGFAYLMGALIAAFIGGIHWLTVEANRQVPAALSLPGLLTLLGSFLILEGAWIVGLLSAFRRR